MLSEETCPTEPLSEAASFSGRGQGGEARQAPDSRAPSLREGCGTTGTHGLGSHPRQLYRRPRKVRRGEKTRRNSGGRPARAGNRGWRRRPPDCPGCRPGLRPRRSGLSGLSSQSAPKPAPATRPHGDLLRPREDAPRSAPAARRESRALRHARGQGAGAEGRRCPRNPAPRRYSSEERTRRDARGRGPRGPRLLLAPGAPTGRRASPAPAPPTGPPGPLPAGTPHSVIGWRRGSLARACGCSYKNPRVPAHSSSRSATALPGAARAPARAQRPRTLQGGRGREAGGQSSLPLAHRPPPPLREGEGRRASKNRAVQLPDTPPPPRPLGPSGPWRRGAWTRCC